MSYNDTHTSLPKGHSMTSYHDIESQMLDALDMSDFGSEEVTRTIRNLQTFRQLMPQPEPAPTPEPEPEPKQPWWDRHGDAILKGGFGLLSVLAIVGGEKLGNHMYNTKAWNSIPK